jgi:ferredoxin like protein
VTAISVLPLNQRLALDHFDIDDGGSHILVNQESCASRSLGPLLVAVCPAGVYSLNGVGQVDVEYAACLECGTCFAAVPEGTLSWHYPSGSCGISFREG